MLRPVSSRGHLLRRGQSPLALLAPLALLSAPAAADEPPPVEPEAVTERSAAERMRLLDTIVAQRGAAAFADVALHLWDADADVRAHAVRLIGAMGDPGGLARPRIEELARGSGSDAPAARSVLIVVYAERRRAPMPVAPAAAPVRAAGPRGLKEAGAPDPALVRRAFAGPPRDFPPFSSATTLGADRSALDVQFGNQVDEMSLRVGVHDRVDVGGRLVFWRETFVAGQIRLGLVRASSVAWLVHGTLGVPLAEGDLRAVQIVWGAGSTATFGGPIARVVAGGEVRGFTEDEGEVVVGGPAAGAPDPRGLLQAGFEISPIRSFLTLKLVATIEVPKQDDERVGFLVGFDGVF